MENYGVIITRQYKPVDFIRCKTEKDAENIYQELKSKGNGVVKVKIEKAYEVQAVTFKDIPDTYQVVTVK